MTQRHRVNAVGCAMVPQLKYVAQNAEVKKKGDFLSGQHAGRRID
jgi:hypothetical protein